MSVSITVILFTAACFLAIIVSLAARYKLAGWVTGLATVLAALGGFVIYGYGFAQQTEFLPLAVIRAVTATLGMFLTRNDFSAVAGTPLFSSSLSVFLFWLAHFLALYATASAALITLGANALRQLRLWLALWGDSTVIFGVNADSVAFAQGLSDKRHPLVFVDKQPDGSLGGSIAAMGAVLRSDEAAAAPNRRFLRSIGMRPGKRRLTVYALDKDPDRNLSYAAALRGCLEEAGIQPRQSVLVLSGAGDDAGESLQAAPGRYGFGSVTVFDDAALAARLLMQEFPPCNSIAFDEEGRATEDMEALIVGFGQMGQAVLRQILMHGQFEGSHFHLAVFAPDCCQVNGFFFGGSALEEAYDISFRPFDARSGEMYRYLREKRSRLKYIVVCTGSPRLNREIAGELGRCLDRLSCGAALYQCSKQGVLYRSAPGQPCRQKGIYSPEVLCTDRMDRMAMAFNQAYCAGNGRSGRENWADCDYFSRLSCRAAADFLPAVLRAAGKTQQQVLAGDWELSPAQLENLSRTEHKRWCAFHYVMGFSPMDSETFRERADRCLREGGGRIGKDMERRLHACLIPWEELDALSAAENALTGGHTDYKALDRANILSVPEVLRCGMKGGDDL